MSDDFAAAHPITSADVNEHAKLLAKLTDIRRQKDSHFQPMAAQFALCIAALQQLQITLANMPRVTARLHRITVDAEPAYDFAAKLIEAEQSCLRG